MTAGWDVRNVKTDDVKGPSFSPSYKILEVEFRISAVILFGCFMTNGWSRTTGQIASVFLAITFSRMYVSEVLGLFMAAGWLKTSVDGLTNRLSYTIY